VVLLTALYLNPPVGNETWETTELQGCSSSLNPKAAAKRSQDPQGLPTGVHLVPNAAISSGRPPCDVAE